MKGVLRALLIVAVLVGAAFALPSLLRHSEEAPSDRLVLYGNIDIREVELAFNASDRIATVEVEEGDAVKKGQLLATLETERLALAVDLARAQEDAQRQLLARLEAGSRPEEIARARAEVAALEAQATNAAQNWERVSKLGPEGVLTPERVDRAVAEKNATKAQLEAARQTLDLLVQGPRQEDTEAARAQLQALGAALALAKQNLAYARLYAPADGVVRTRVLEPGDMASPLRPVFTFALRDPLWVRAYVSEQDLGKVRPGMPARVTVDSYPDKAYEGWVGYISPTAEFTPKTVETPEIRVNLVYQVRVYVKNPQDELRLGMPATVELELDGAGDAS
jgi:HlyD family secretion protein